VTAKKIGILTGGGDCPGLNAVIRAVVRVVEATAGPKLVDLEQFADAEVFFG
jgi:ATP-dependent phosphofructokinase / diphosphate-dependent phosphofructokinase